MESESSESLDNMFSSLEERDFLKVSSLGYRRENVWESIEDEISKGVVGGAGGILGDLEEEAFVLFDF